MTDKLEFVHPCMADVEPMNHGKRCGAEAHWRVTDGVYLCPVHVEMAHHASVPILGGGAVRKVKRSVEHCSKIVDELDGD